MKTSDILIFGALGYLGYKLLGSSITSNTAAEAGYGSAAAYNADVATASTRAAQIINATKAAAIAKEYAAPSAERLNIISSNVGKDLRNISPGVKKGVKTSNIVIGAKVPVATSTGFAQKLAIAKKQGLL